jgi:hypothetical protein
MTYSPHLQPTPAVTLGLDPRALNLAKAPQVQCPRVGPEGDDRVWGGRAAMLVDEEQMP